jgi:F-type H+/Na+-transporting ATPase subunit alpha
VLRFERELLDGLKRNTKILDKLRDTNVLDDDTVDELGTYVEKFKKEFQTGDGRTLDGPGSEQFDEIPLDDINQEKIVKSRR